MRPYRILPILAAQVLAFMVFAAPAHAERFSFAVIADPHLDGTPDHQDKLERAVQWVIANRDSAGIELAFIVGDIGWGETDGTSNLAIAKQILDELDREGIPYVPLIGDDEIQSGHEQEFDAVFADQYDYLASVVANWKKAPTPVKGMYLQSFSFDYRFCHFVCPDFVSRRAGDEGGALHDFSDGSWPWFKTDVSRCAKPAKENVLVMTHVGMFRTGVSYADQFLFSSADLGAIKTFLKDYSDYVSTNYAGHIHQNWSAGVRDWWKLLYNVKVTDETWYDARFPERGDTDLTVRLISASKDSSRSSSRVSYRDATYDLD